MILQSLTNTRQCVPNLDANLAQQVGRADPGNLKQLWRANCSCTEDHLSTRMCAYQLAAAAVFHPDDATSIKGKPLGESVGHHTKIPAAHDRPQKTMGSADAATISDRTLIIANAFLR